LTVVLTLDASGGNNPASDATDATVADSHWIKASGSYADVAHVITEVWYYPNNPGGIKTMSFSSNGTVQFAWGVMSEWHGASTTQPLRSASISSASNTSSLSLTSSIASGDVAVTLFGAVSSSCTNVTWHPGPGYTQQAQYDSLSNPCTSFHTTGDQRIESTSATSTSDAESATLLSGTFASVVGSIAVFQP
jgi:hypothetical protein